MTKLYIKKDGSYVSLFSLKEGIWRLGKKDGTNELNYLYESNLPDSITKASFLPFRSKFNFLLKEYLKKLKDPSDIRVNRILNLFVKSMKKQGEK